MEERKGLKDDYHLENNYQYSSPNRNIDDFSVDLPFGSTARFWDFTSHNFPLES
jgi:hypothetical protein